VINPDTFETLLKNNQEIALQMLERCPLACETWTSTWRAPSWRQRRNAHEGFAAETAEEKRIEKSPSPPKRRNVGGFAW